MYCCQLLSCLTVLVLVEGLPGNGPVLLLWEDVRELLGRGRSGVCVRGVHHGGVYQEPQSKAMSSSLGKMCVNSWVSWWRGDTCLPLAGVRLCTREGGVLS